MLKYGFLEAQIMRVVFMYGKISIRYPSLGRTTPYEWRDFFEGPLFFGSLESYLVCKVLPRGFRKANPTLLRNPN